MVITEQRPHRLIGVKRFFPASRENKPQSAIPNSPELFTDLVSSDSVGSFVKDISTKMVELLVSPRRIAQREYIGLPITNELRSSVVRTETELAGGWMSIHDSSPSDSLLIEDQPVQHTAIDIFIPPSLQTNLRRLMYRNPLLRDEKIDYIARRIDTIRVTYITKDGIRREFLTSCFGNKNWHISDSTDTESSIVGTYNRDPEIDSILETRQFSSIRDATHAILNGFTTEKDPLSHTSS